MQHSTRPDSKLLSAYYDLWFQKVRRRADQVGYSASDRYNDAVKMRLLRSEVGPQMLRPGAAWLDYGCGPAHLFKEVAAPKGVRRVGVDISPAIIAENRKRFAASSDIEFHALDDGFLDSVPPASFDCITCIEVLEHVYGVDEIIGRFSRLLRPGGTLWITTPNGRRAAPALRAMLPEKVMLYLEDRVAVRGIDALEETDPDLARFRIKTHFHEFSAPELKQRLEGHGLKVESIALLALKAMPNRTFNFLAERVPGFVRAMEAMDERTRHWPVGFFKTCLMMRARRG